MENRKLRIAVARGRVLKDILPLLDSIGMGVIKSDYASRKLILSTVNDDLEVIVIRSADVVTYVEYGTADFGIVGRDVIMEYTGGNLYELCDLGISRCRMVVAARPDYRRDSLRRVRVASKYLQSTRRHFAKQGWQIEVIKLYGSMELAPLVGIADMIVDLVDTGRTLEENKLVEVEEIAQISARLIANKAQIKMKGVAMRELTDLLSSVAERNGDTI